MTHVLGLEGLIVRVGGQPRSVLLQSLQDFGIRLNAHAEPLLEHQVFDDPDGWELRSVERTVRQLGSAGRAPSGALHIASEPLSDDEAYPKGFYLRVVDGETWLRGFRCDDTYEWGPEQLLALVQP